MDEDSLFQHELKQHKEKDTDINQLIYKFKKQIIEVERERDEAISKFEHLQQLYMASEATQTFMDKFDTL